MKARQTIKSLLFSVAALGAMAVQNASASTYGFQNITNNSSVNVANQLSMDVLASGTTGAVFKFFNNVGTASSITDIYFDDVNSPGTALFKNTGSDKFKFLAASSGVSFDSSANPANLPGGVEIGFTANYSGDSNTPNVSGNGVNTNTEWVSFLGTFASGNIDGLIAALNNGTFRVGLHVQSIAGAGAEDSDGFVNVSPVPLPAAAWLFGSALFGFMMVSNRRKV